MAKTVGLVFAVALALGGYLIASSRVYGMGFPLDDAWIHQTYGRNLGELGQWAFIPGQPSAGSTAPLWSSLLALGYLLHLPYLAWAYLLGGLSLLGLVLAGEALARQYLPGYPRRIPWIGLFLAGEWHLVWAAASGMETQLFGLCVLLALYGCCLASGFGTIQVPLTPAGRGRGTVQVPLTPAERGRGWLVVGLMVGLSVWVRPDGITLLGPAAFTLLLGAQDWHERARGMAWLAGGAALLFVPYLLFNLLVQGSLWPNTFYAKQAEYAAMRQFPILVRYFNEIKLPLIGSGLFLLPGFVAFTWKAWRERNWAVLAAVTWFLGYAFLYALRLPVTYQYGRYFIPAMPVYFVLGLCGTIRLLENSRDRKLPWLLARVGLLSGVGVWLAFYIIGAGRYAQDVAIIETEMVAAARWTADHTPPDALIAAHDIGAMGYFGRRRLLDLAGLVSPEVIPFIRDETRLARWLDEQNADYLVILSGWYAKLPEGKPVLYQSDGQFVLQSGGQPMEIYRWRGP